MAQETKLFIKHESSNSAKPLMLWKDDFIRESDWIAICDILNLPPDTQEIELKASVVSCVPYFVS